MFKVSKAIEIECSHEEVFAFAGDYSKDSAWRGGVISMDYETSGPPTFRLRTKERMRSLGLSTTTVAEVFEYSPTRTSFRSISGPVPCSGSRDFQACPAGTRFTYTVILNSDGFRRLIDPLLGLFLAWQLTKDLRRLKRQLEKKSENNDSLSTLSVWDEPT
ncbi:SRPBCC family protein [Hydrogenophaga sp. Root209]|uniref:SRPBCC family protein n=1 Tax=Hydrogenophaga sp. Root209 TaxID=1736490 RepID=UPI0012E38089